MWDLHLFYASTRSIRPISRDTQHACLGEESVQLAIERPRSEYHLEQFLELLQRQIAGFPLQLLVDRHRHEELRLRRFSFDRRRLMRLEPVHELLEMLELELLFQAFAFLQSRETAND